MAKRRAEAVEKKSRGPWTAIAAGVCFALALFCVFVLIASGGVPELVGVENVLRGLGGDLSLLLPLVFVWLGALLAMRARGMRVATWKLLVNALFVLLIFGAFHMFYADYINENGYHVTSALGYGDFLKKSYDFRVGGGALGAVIGGFLYLKIGVWPGFFVSLLLAALCLAVNGYLGKWIRAARRRAEENRVLRAEDERRRREEEADRNFELDRRTMLRSEELIHTPPVRRTRPHEPEAAVAEPPAERPAARRRAARPSPDEPVSPMDAPRRRAAKAENTPEAAEGEAPAPARKAAKKRVSTKPRIYNETVEEGQAEEGADAFGPVVRVGGAVPGAHAAGGGKKTAAKKSKAPEKQEDGQLAFQDDLTIEPDEYELPDDEAPFDVPASGKKPLPKFKKTEAVEEEEEYAYPPIDLLSHGKAPDRHESDQSDMEKAQLLCDTLRSFGIETRLTGIAHGPAVTRFELQPAPGVKVSRITSLSDDIALNLAAERVRIEAPIPGKAAVGVEVPNDKVETVSLRDVLESAEARRHPSRLAVGLGKDNSGRYIVADIAKMPHVLIAGQTGSGKSVCINAIIVSILYRATPDEVKLILIDPKVVELSVYNGIPHLIAPVVTDPKKAASALDWAVAEMTQRYKRFAERGVRDIKGYNKALEDGEKPMPQIVIIIDELADLMMVAPGEVEDSICRLAQLARAAGMHLVIATQRPSVNVITGIIKANIPTRIAFSVASQVDSRTMIDHGGAEKLLGNGDMLFVPSGINKPMRVQGAWVSDQEVHAVTEYIKQRHETTYDEDVVEKINQSVMSDAEKEEAAEEYDPRLPEAVEIVIEAGQASISMLQRRMRVGYARAGRLIDDMAQRGIVSEADGAKPRSVLITREQFQQMFDEGEEQ